MPHRGLRTSSRGVSVIGLGCMALSGAYGPVGDQDAVGILEKALDIGINHFDTADVYGGGSNETLLGCFLKRHRDAVVIASKGGATRTANNRASNDGRPEYLRRACEASLQRLGIDCIDLYYLHRVDPLVPFEESVGAMADLVAAGKVRAIGLSEVAPETLRRAHRIHPIAAVQTEYSLSARDAEAEILPLCKELGILFVAYSPLGRGLWGGLMQAGEVFAQGDIRSGIPRFKAGNLEHNLHLAGELSRIASQHQMSLPQLALAWVLSRGEHVVAIPGTRNTARLAENAAAGTQRLPSEALDALERFSVASVKGLRHSEQMLARTNL
jgi:aryl-alcohol dehydrogenase-like predicted oxidoreductase